MGSLARSIQFFVLALFGDYLLKKGKNFWNEVPYALIFVVSLLLIILETLYMVKTGKRFGFHRFYLFVGEPNFSSLFYLFFMALALIQKQLLYATGFGGLIFLTQSRMGVLCGILTLILYAFKEKKNIVKFLTVSLTLMVFVYPLAIQILNKLNTPEQKVWLANKYSTRYYIHDAYMKAFCRNPLGLGYFEGKKEITPYVEDSIKDYKDNLKEQIELEIEQHNFFIHFISGSGIVGTLFFLVISLVMLSAVFNRPENSLLWLPLFSASVLINFSHELVLFMAMSYVLTNTSDDWKYKWVVFKQRGFPEFLERIKSR